jgi:hypothetical protein
MARKSRANRVREGRERYRYARRLRAALLGGSRAPSRDVNFVPGSPAFFVIERRSARST